MDPLVVAANFRLTGTPCAASRHGQGHINDTWLIRTTAKRDYILQRINAQVFPQPLAVMRNVETVTRHLKQHSHAPAKLALVETHDSTAFLVDDAGVVWRVYRYVQGTYSVSTAAVPAQAYEAGRMFGLFLKDISSLDPSLLKPTLPGFHSLRSRLDGLRQARQEADPARLQSVARDLDFVAARSSWTDTIARRPGGDELPLRITHNDCKLNNVLFHGGTHNAVCVVDLDTVMPGLILYDFGDLVRSTSAISAEDEVSRTSVGLDLEYFRATAEGYLGVVGTQLTSGERELLVFSCRYIAFMLGVRFLTDYLAGDTYFKTHRPNQNLDRARVQFRMTELMEARQSEMEDIVAQLT